MIPAVAAALEPRPGHLGGILGAYCVNAGIFEELQRLEAIGDPGARALRRRLAATDAAWILAERAYRLGLRGSPAFAIVDPRSPARQSGRRARRRLTYEQRAKARGRYRSLSAARIDAWATPHLRRDPRAGLYRPMWLDHRWDCRRPGRCHGCARIPFPPQPRWRRGRRGRSHMSVAEWLVGSVVPRLRTCNDVVALQDRVCDGHLVLPQSCHVRTCPDCEAQRQQRVIARFQEAVEQLEPASFATFTVKNGPPGMLQERLTHLDRALETLRRRAVWRGGRCRDRRRCRMPRDPAKPGWRLPHPPITASLLTIETTEAGRGWHPHAHVVFEGPYIAHDELRDTWEAITGDSLVVHVERVRTYAEQNHAGNVERSLRELLKYAAKGSPAFLEQRHGGPLLAELLVGLRGRRLTRAGGKLAGLELEEEADPLEGQELVLVYPPGEGDPYRAPRVCPLHEGPASWRLAGFVPRVECRPEPDLRRPGRTVLAWRPAPPPPPA